MYKLTLTIIALFLITGCAQITEIKIDDKPVATNTPSTATIKTIKTNLEKLQGKWRSVDDKNSVVEFSVNKKFDHYDGQIMFTADFKLFTQTDLVDQNNNGQYLVAKENEEEFKYNITELDDKNLTLMFLPRGNLLKYTKMP